MALRLDEAAFDRLLEILGADREQAARRYEEIRRTLIRYFDWRGCGDPPGLADEVMDRVARRLAQGETIRAKDPGSYFLGVARNVWREELKRMQRERTGLSEAASSLSTERAGDDPEGATETALGCLDRCLDALPPETRTLVVQYYQDDGARRIDRRRRLAEALAIEPGTLRIRMLRLRERLERCVVSCIEDRPVTEGRAGTPADGGSRR
jgi:DNA-directed RNA polymerase specialized sigma24 family protein